MSTPWTARSSQNITVAALTILAMLFALAIINTLPIRGPLLLNADILFPSAYANNLIHHPETIAFFQLPRIPSFFPDLFVFVLFSTILPHWQAVVAVYAVLSYAALVLAAGAVVAQVSGRRLSQGIGIFLPASVLAILFDAQFVGSNGPFLFIFAPVIHSGSFLLSLAGLLLARHLIGRPSLPLGCCLFVVALLGTASDKLFVGSFLIPLIGGGLAPSILARRQRHERPWPVLVVAVLGCVGGFVLDRILFSAVLSRQPDSSIDIPVQLSRTHLLLESPDFYASLVVVALALAVPALWQPRSRAILFWWPVGAVAALGFLGAFMLLYIDSGSARYAQPLWWWGLIVFAAGILRASPRVAVLSVGLVAATAFCAAAAQDRNLRDPANFASLRTPVAECLAPWRQNGTIHAGIADYWKARGIEASSNWTIQVEQVSPEGSALFWGNNQFYYLKDKIDRSKPALFDFIVMQDLDQNAINRRFGEPTQIIQCPGTAVWVYSAPGGIGRSIGNIAQASNSICLGPADFTTYAGPLGPEGVIMPATPAPRRIETWGPYVRLKAGTWNLQLTYSLDSPAAGNAEWDVVANGGALGLQSGTLGEAPAFATKDVRLQLKRDTDRLEFRTLLQPGDHLRIKSFRMTRAGAPEKPCDL